MIGTGLIQAAIFARLVAAAVVDDGRVIDGEASDPVKIGFPYVQIGETQTLDDDVVGRAGVEEFLTLHIWSRYRGQIEVKSIAAAIETDLHASSLIVEGFETVDVFIRDLRVFDDPDGLTRHGVLTLHIHAFGR